MQPIAVLREQLILRLTEEQLEMLRIERITATLERTVLTTDQLEEPIERLLPEVLDLLRGQPLDLLQGHRLVQEVILLLDQTELMLQAEVLGLQTVLIRQAAQVAEVAQEVFLRAVLLPEVAQRLPEVLLAEVVQVEVLPEETKKKWVI